MTRATRTRTQTHHARRVVQTFAAGTERLTGKPTATGCQTRRAVVNVHPTSNQTNGRNNYGPRWPQTRPRLLPRQTVREGGRVDGRRHRRSRRHCCRRPESSPIIIYTFRPYNSVLGTDIRENDIRKRGGISVLYTFFFFFLFWSVNSSDWRRLFPDSCTNHPRFPYAYISLRIIS